MSTPKTASDFGEPWDFDGENWITDSHNAEILNLDSIHSKNAKRLIACVNASAGYSTEALQGAGVGYFHKAIKEMIAAIKIKDAALEACEPAVRACAGMSDPAAEIRALREAASCLSRLVDHGHAEDCLFLNRANAPCDCGVDQAQATLAKLRSIL